MTASERECAGVGVVVIGRNEGERLLRSLRSVRSVCDHVVYVDSGSTDGSVERARSLGAVVVELDPRTPFTAARARNEGFERLVAHAPQLDLVQVVDGDCELADGWLAAATATLRLRPELAAVCGRRRERFPEASPWNQLADVEWDGPAGEVDSFGGDALIRVRAWRSAGGYDPTLIAGEDPEFSWRIRQQGGRILRLDREMTLHDAALLRFSQWWRRQTRSGHAFAETVWRHRAAPDPRRSRRLVAMGFWAAAWPLACVAVAAVTNGAGLAGLAAYAWPWLGGYRAARARWPRRIAALWASSCVLVKAAEFQGALTFAWNHGLRRRATALIEYKGPGS